MRYKKVVKKSLNRLPYIKNLAKDKARLMQEIQQQVARADHLQAEVAQLRARNDLWAEEVRAMRGEAKSLNILWPVEKRDLIEARWWDKSKLPTWQKKQPPFSINWVVPPMGPVSGGHANIFRFIDFLESKGHLCRIYFYDPMRQYSFDQLKEAMRSYPLLKAKLYYNVKEMADCDGIFATSWHTAYPVFNFNKPTKKFYFVQDFEPFFDPVGSYSTLAENTYKFGFHGVTLGSWLKQKLERDYSMPADDVNLGVNLKVYSLINKAPRKKIFFYARPVTPRRGFELGVLGLEIFHKSHPEYEINFVGWDIKPYKIPFFYVNHGILPLKKLNELYNQCAAGLVLSFTNMSLLPLEMMAAGAKPVINDAEHTRLVNYKSAVEYAHPSPAALAEGLATAIKDTNSPKKIQDLAKVATNFQWEDSYIKFEQILTRELS